ncbi:hypothetical protein KSP40_PGU001037 [Platanthera guangdongensis]|uniref:Uncharacterized protein n=1 Tax=Platanthera guangdongensis TaxID=2320717 RepID=A0ABR2M2M7_9ASPA
MSKLMEFARKAWFLVRVLSGYEERRIRSYRLDLQRRILQAQIRKEELRRLPEQTILAELRQMVEEMQGVNRQIQQTESAIEEYFKPLDKNAEIIINLQLEKEEERMKGMMKAMHEQSAQQQISGEAKSSESTNSCNTRPIQPIDPVSSQHENTK